MKTWSTGQTSPTKRAALVKWCEKEPELAADNIRHLELQVRRLDETLKRVARICNASEDDDSSASLMANVAQVVERFQR